MIKEASMRSVRLLVVLGLALVASAAKADTDHYLPFHGSMCSANSSETVNRDVNGIANTKATADATVWCPIPFERNVAFSTMVLSSVSVDGYDRNSSFNITCTVWVMSQTMAGVISISNLGSLSSSGGGPNWPASAPQSFTLNFTDPRPSMTGTSSLYLSCVIPRSEQGAWSHVSQYRVRLSTP